MARIPLKERLWCRPGEAAPFIGRGKTYVYEKIRSGEIVSRLDGRTRLIHVPSLIVRCGLAGDQIEPSRSDQHRPEAVVSADSKTSAPAVTEITSSTRGSKGGRGDS